jgi:hypothetical protein
VHWLHWYLESGTKPFYAYGSSDCSLFCLLQCFDHQPL